MKIDHIGYAVRRIDRAIDAFKELGFNFCEMIDDTDRNVKLAFGEKDGYRIELVSPLDKEKKSPVDQYVNEASGTPYHICYVSENIEEDIKNLEKNRFKVMIPLTPAVAFDNRRVVFMYSLHIGLIEIVEAY